MRADELLDTGDMDGQAVWKQILAAVEELLAKEPPEGGEGSLGGMDWVAVNLFTTTMARYYPRSVFG